MIGEEGEGQSYPMQERDERNPVKKDSFEKRMERRKMIRKALYDPVDNNKNRA